MQADYLPFDGEPYILDEEETERTANALEVFVALDQTGVDWLEKLYTRNETVN